MTTAFADFVERFSGYAGTASLDEVRRREFSRLDHLGHADLLLASVFGNPHSINPTSRASTEAVERCRERVLRFFGADPREYTVVFTSNASQALKLVGEAFPFEAGSQFVLTFDNHNSVNGIREFARARGAATQYVPVLPPGLRSSPMPMDDHSSGCTARGRPTIAEPRSRSIWRRLTGASLIMRRLTRVRPPDGCHSGPAASAILALASWRLDSRAPTSRRA